MKSAVLWEKKKETKEVMETESIDLKKRAAAEEFHLHLFFFFFEVEG